MGRRKSFDEDLVLEQAGKCFARYGFEACSLDQLVEETGLLRGSLYAAFGSKRGIFLASLARAMAKEKHPMSMELILVAMMELSARDEAIREQLEAYLKGKGPDFTRELGACLLERGKLEMKDEKRGKKNGK
ncbi:TetR/AcrR family transcriptional regulator [Lactococcus termiticola]|uniref:TetR family transcriptional regulator n=1 Tax=Lactococcus termiticola TaxID=2169526 RepID=A0A2R5HDJ9_9LACT|nr:helix-turn-helix domain-containing protein [Lactococcus termiticola]GBG96092.1 TetR family transcriptional regulator [Lactococcus termiticola]